MPWPRHYLVQFRGTLGTATADYEQWVTGIRLARHIPLAPDLDMTDALLADVAADFGTMLTELSFSSAMEYREARAYDIGADGRALDVWYHTLPSPWRGVATENAHPWQVALAVTLDTGAQRPPARFGRMYLPAPAIFVGQDGLVSAGATSIWADATARFINRVNDRPGGDGTTRHVSVVSPLGTDGTIRPVTSVRVGRALDTIRSRRAQLQEGHVAATVAVA